MLIASTLLAAVRADCTANAFKDAYAALVLPPNPDPQSNLSYLNNYLKDGLVTTFAAFTPDTIMWCANGTDVFPTAPTDFCCTLNQVQTISWQLASRYIVGASNLVAQAVKAFMKELKFCVINPTSGSPLDHPFVNKSIWNIYYSIYKITVAAQPASQTLACLICLADADVATYVTPESLILITPAAYDSYLSAYIKALVNLSSSIQNMAKQMTRVIAGKHLHPVQNASCTSRLRNAQFVSRLCESELECQPIAISVINNVLQEVGMLQNFISDRNYPLGQKVSTFTYSVKDAGVGLSQNQQVIDNIILHGATGVTLSQSMSKAGRVLLALLPVLALLS